MTRAKTVLRGMGADACVLWVAVGNLRARHFYARQGGEPVAERVDQLGGSVLAEVRYRFDLREARNDAGTD